MGEIIASFIMPHPPVIIPEVGRGQEKGAANTADAAARAAKDIAALKPTTIILTTPHGPVFQDHVYISADPMLRGDFGKFGASKVKLEFQNNTSLISSIIANANKEGISAGGLEAGILKRYSIPRELDHGALVPLYFINREFGSFKLVHISIAGLSFKELYKFGMCISKAVRDSEERAVFVASGDLSHKLTDEGPYGYDPKGPEFDRLLVDSLRTMDIERLMELDETFCESAGECGLRSFIMMFGAFDGMKLKPEVYSYEGPFGVGYTIARFIPEGESPDMHILDRLETKYMEMINKVRNDEDPYIAIARKTLEVYVRDGKKIKPGHGIPEELLSDRAGVFVTIKKDGRLRGCIGTIEPTQSSIAEEIINNAISSGTRDPRFDPVEEDELDSLVYSVDVLKEPEPISSMDQLDVIRYGVIVRSGRRSGLLLPNLEGVDTPDRQVDIALQKAGISPDEHYDMERFEVIRHK